MDEFSQVEVKKPWKRFQVSFTITFLLYLLFEFDLIEIASIPIMLCLLTSVLITLHFLSTSIIESSNHKFIPFKRNLILILLFTLSIPLISLYRTGYFWGRVIISAEFIDDISRTDIDFFEDGHYIIVESWMFGAEKHLGTYKQIKDTFDLDKYPISKKNKGGMKMLQKNDKLFFRQDSFGKYDTSYYYFRISKPSK